MAKAKKKEVVEDVVDVTPEVTVPAEQEAPKLTVQDIKDLLTIVDAAAKRGAFQAGEMQMVGTAYNKVKGFVDAVEPKPEDGADGTGSVAE